MDFLNELAGYVKMGGENFVNNAFGIWETTTVTRGIRIVAIIGAYLLLRPYLVKLGEWQFKKELEKENASAVEQNDALTAKISPNALRGGAAATGTKGKEGARKRGKAEKEKSVIEKLQEIEDSLKAEDVVDDITPFLKSDVLVDYKEGEDGW